MIKRITFATRRPMVGREDFAGGWRRAVAVPLGAPPSVRPVRIVTCLSLPDVIPDPCHDGIGIEWFRDAGHLESYEEWLAGPRGRDARELLESALDPDDSTLLVADELVLRGSDWLDERWRQGGPKLKHMAIARRARGLTREEFSLMWKGRAGQIRRAGGAAVDIPEEARGLAYVQNHPRPGTAVDGAYDALNEVYFDDVESLRLRAEWFRAHMTGAAEADMVAESWFVAAREELVLPTGK